MKIGDKVKINNTVGTLVSISTKLDETWFYIDIYDGTRTITTNNTLEIISEDEFNNLIIVDSL